MRFLFDEAFDYNDLVTQVMALASNLPQKTKSTPANPTANNNGFVLDNTAAGAAAGQGFMSACPLSFYAATGTIVLTCVKDGGSADQADVGTAITGLTTVDLDETGNYIEDNNGGSSTNFTTEGFVAGGFVKVNGATSSNSLKWNGLYRISSISSNGGGTNNRINLTAADIVGSPGDFSGVSGVTLTPIASAAAFTVSGTAGVAGLLVVGQRFVRDHYSVMVRRTLADFSSSGNADRFTMTFSDGAATTQWKYSPATIDFSTASDTIVDDDGSDLTTLGFRVGGGVLVEGSSSNDGLHPITAIGTSSSTNDQLTTSNNLTTTSNDAGATITPMNSTAALSAEVNFTASNDGVQRTDLVDWRTLGIFPGDYVIISDAVDGANNDTHRVLDVIATTQTGDTLLLDNALADESADTITITGYFVPERFGIQKLSWNSTDTLTEIRDAERVTGEEAPLEDLNGDFSTQWNWEAPGLLLGSGVSERIFGGLWTFFDQASSAYNCSLIGADGFVNSSTATGQPNAERCNVHLEENAFTFLACFNGDHLRGSARIANSIDEPFYLGYGDLLGARGQHPAPYLIGGTSEDDSFNANSSDVNHRAWFDPASNSSVTISTSCKFRDVDGTWQDVTHSQSGSSYEPSGTNPDFFWRGQRDFSTSSGFTDNPAEFRYPLRLRLKRTLGGGYQLFPLELMGISPINVFMVPYGVKTISGDGNASQNTTVIDGVTWLVVQNVSETDVEDYAAIAME